MLAASPSRLAEIGGPKAAVPVRGNDVSVTTQDHVDPHEMFQISLVAVPGHLVVSNNFENRPTGEECSTVVEGRPYILFRDTP